MEGEADPDERQQFLLIKTESSEGKNMKNNKEKTPPPQLEYKGTNVSYLNTLTRAYRPRE